METAYLPSYIFAAIAVVALVVTLVLAVVLIFAKKEKRREMKKSKIAAVISAVLVPLSAGMAVILFPIIIIDTYPPIEKMPNIIGLSYAECKENYSDKFELVAEEGLYSFDYPEGTIIEQMPFAYSEYLVGRTTVKCKISKGPRMVPVSNVIGLDFETAKEILENEGFTVGIVYDYSEDVPKGKVIATDPPANERVVYGSAVKVTVSKGNKNEKE